MRIHELAADIGIPSKYAVEAYKTFDPKGTYSPSTKVDWDGPNRLFHETVREVLLKKVAVKTLIRWAGWRR